MNILRQAAKRFLTACVPARWLLTRGPRRMPSGPHAPPGRYVAAGRPRLALTFDDGPHPEYTAKLLDTLRDAGLHATFFVVGRDAARSPDLIRRIAGEGHELGNHTWSHGEPARTSPRQFLDEVRRTDELLLSLTGSIPQTMRPPKGELNWSKLLGLWRQAKTVALWNVDPRDYRMTEPGDMIAWAAHYEPRDGDVLLFHDNHPWGVGAVESMRHRGLFDRFEAVTVSAMTRGDHATRSCTGTSPVATAGHPPG
jgi:peptidoglycan/xylan/chitin deacetylase (PgdA/CDA1 family)